MFDFKQQSQCDVKLLCKTAPSFCRASSKKARMFRVVLLGLAFVSSASNTSFADDTAFPTEISVTDAKPLLGKDGVYWIDCRELDEWRTGYIPGSTLHPKSKIPSEIQKFIDKKNQRVIVYCRSGVRSLAVTKLLRQSGFAKAQSMTGGFLAWTESLQSNK